jgi:hypothetical protein
MRRDQFLLYVFCHINERKTTFNQRQCSFLLQARYLLGSRQAQITKLELHHACSTFSGRLALREANIPLERARTKKYATTHLTSRAMTALVQKDNKRAGRKTGEAQNLLQTVRQEKAVKHTWHGVHLHDQRRGVSAADYIFVHSNADFLRMQADADRYGTDSEEPPTLCLALMLVHIPVLEPLNLGFLCPAL